PSRESLSAFCAAAEIVHSHKINATLVARDIGVLLPVQQSSLCKQIGSAVFVAGVYPRRERMTAEAPTSYEACVFTSAFSAATFLRSSPGASIGVSAINAA